MSLDGHSIPVIGVTPPSFFGVEVGSRYDVAIPLCADRLLAEDKKGRIPVPSAWWLSMMGRLKPGWTAKSATAHLHALSPGIMRATLPPGYKPNLAKRYLANKLAATEAGTGDIRVARAIRASVVAVDGDHRSGVVDRLCKFGQSAAGAGHCARTGDRRETCHWRIALETGAPASGGKSAAGDCRRGARGRAGAGAEPRTDSVYQHSGKSDYLSILHLTGACWSSRLRSRC